jgi:hypothetical protein
MADRESFKDDLRVLLRSLSRQPMSSMHLLWAWFGAGKTHTLHYISHLCKSEYTNVIPFYTEFPRTARNFLDVYRRFMNNAEMQWIDEAYVKVFADDCKANFQRQLKQGNPDFANALRLHYTGKEEQQDICRRWLRAEVRELRTLRSVGIVRPIDTSEDAANVLIWLIQLFNHSGSAIEGMRRVVIMLDEYQRIDKFRNPAVTDISGCLHSIFNACANGLTIVISFSGYPEEKKLPNWLSDEIKDRLDKKILVLPRFSHDEAMRFVLDVLRHFRNPSADIPGEYFPFEKDSISTLIDEIEKAAKNENRHDEPKPRTLMKLLNSILQEGEPLIEAGKMRSVNSDFALSVLGHFSILGES